MKQEAFYDRLRLLRKHGLKAATMLKLVEVWSQGAGVHIMRAAPVSEAWARKVDDSTGRMVAELLPADELITDSQRLQIFVPKKQGGLGLGSMLARRRPAWLGAWEGGLSKVADTLGFQTLKDIQNGWPELLATIQRMEKEHEVMTNKKPPAHKWAKRIKEAEPKQQRVHLKEINKHMARMMRDKASLEDEVRLEGASSGEACAWMDPPSGVEPLPDEHFRIALGMRLNVARPLQGGLTLCQNYTAKGRHCAAPCDGDKGQHALTCQFGGLSLDRHDHITEALGRWLGECGFAWKTEQAAAEYDTPERRARLDLWYADPFKGHTWVDVTICASAAHDGVSVQQRFARREKDKHDRYAGGELIPFALDPRGSWGPEARAWIQHILGQLPEGSRGEARARVRWGVAQALQLTVGEQILASGRAGPPPTPSWTTRGEEDSLAASGPAASYWCPES